ncbi:hypothetical protein Tco_0659128 [Tanacetum coccineum]
MVSLVTKSLTEPSRWIKAFLDKGVMIESSPFVSKGKRFFDTTLADSIWIVASLQASTTLDRRYLLVALEAALDSPITQPLMIRTSLETSRFAVAAVVQSARLDLVSLSSIP